jgi:hypothetical protein
MSLYLLRAQLSLAPRMMAFARARAPLLSWNMPTAQMHRCLSLNSRYSTLTAQMIGGDDPSMTLLRPCQ